MHKHLRPNWRHRIQRGWVNRWHILYKVQNEEYRKLDCRPVSTGFLRAYLGESRKRRQILKVRKICYTPNPEY